MKLIEALQIVQNDRSDGGEEMGVFLACGCTPLHLGTFLTAELQMRFRQRRINVGHGLYGDILGSLERMRMAAPDAGVVVLEWPDFDPRLGIRRLGGGGATDLPDILNSAQAQADRIHEAIGQTALQISLGICQPSLPLPPMSYMSGGQAGTFDLHLRSILGSFCAQLVEETNVRFVNAQRLDRLSPPGERLDVKSELLNGFPYRLPHASAMAELLADLVGPPVAKKGLITDLDDTLWAGVLGEVGLHGISWDLDHHSHIHGLYQQLLSSLSQAGVLIGVASKNDPALVEQAFKREDLILPPEQLFPVDVHWGPKSESIKRILGTWNIGADSVVFVDDSPMELAEVKAVHQDVECLLFPTDRDQAAYGLLEQLRDLFGKDRVLPEDSIRMESIRQARYLTEVSEKAGGISDHFLKESEGEISVSFRKDPLDPRAMELVNKTNQFNLNGRRFVEGAWHAHLEKEESFVLITAYKDKFGPLGKIAVLSGFQEANVLLVDTWVMSCRAFSRRIEYKCLDLLFDQFGVEDIVFEYQPNSKNMPMQEFFAQFPGDATGGGFHLTKLMFHEYCPELFFKTKELAVG